MRRTITATAVAVLVAGLFAVGGTALAGHPENGCATPEGGPLAAGTGVYLCTPVGYAEANADGQYILLDGASSNPDPLDGYIVITAGGAGCADEGTWHNGDPVACNPEVPAPPPLPV